MPEEEDDVPSEMGRSDLAEVGRSEAGRAEGGSVASSGRGTALSADLRTSGPLATPPSEDLGHTKVRC